MKNHRKRLVLAAVVFLVSVASHISALRNSYVLDDFKLIVGNDFIAHPANAAILADPRHLFKPYPLLCGARPLTVLSLMTDHFFWGLNPFGYHLTNMLLHAACGVVLLFTVFLVFRRPRLALFAALVFTLHPVQTEVVNIASFRADILAALFSLLSLLFFVAASNARDTRSYAGAAVCFVLGLMSKETAISIPLIFLLYLFLVKPGIPRKNLGIVLGFGVLVALFMTLFWSSRYEYRGLSAVFPNILGNVSPFSSAAAYCNTLLHSFLHYAKALLFPVGLSVDYQINVQQSLLNDGNLLALVLLAGCAAVFVKSRNRGLKFGLGFALLAYLPVSNLIPLINTVNDRYLYLPMAGFSIAVSAFITALPGRKILGRVPVSIAAAVLLLCFYGAATLNRNPVFRDGYSLYGDAVTKAPDNVRVHYNYAIALMVSEKYTEALREFEAAERLNPDYRQSDILSLKGECYANIGDYAAAKEHFRRSLLAEPDKDVLIRFAALLAEEGSQRGAVSLLEKGTLVLPGVPDLYNELGKYYESQRRYSKALDSYKKAVAIDPDHEKSWLNIILASQRGKRPIPPEDAEKLLDYLRRNGWQIEEKPGK